MLEGWPVVADPLFYAVAVPAVLITGLSKSGFAAGFGSLATPLMALTLPAPQAAAIMLPLLMVMDVTGLQQMWRDRDSVLLRQILPWGVLGVGVGALLFGLLSAKAVAGILGALTLGFLAQRLFFPPRRDGHVAKPWVGRTCAAASGVTSFIAHAGGPPIMAYLLPMKMEPRIMASSMAVYFSVINAVKIASTRCSTSASIAIVRPHSRAVSPGHLLVASSPILPPRPLTGEAKSR